MSTRASSMRFTQEGADAWFNSPPQRFLGDRRDPDHYEQVMDILDVWFDSGSTYVFTVENPIEPSWPKAARADLYLEGSDQHRGWFQSSLLESCGTRGRAPYEAVLTHGFVLDERGHKMSKSLGNTLLPQTIADKNGAEILRTWAASSDFTEDLRIGPEIVKANVDAYRRLRNTIRFMLANLAGFAAREQIGFDAMPPLERYILARLAELDQSVRRGLCGIRFQPRLRTALQFLHQRAFGVLFRYPQGCALLRPCGLPEAPRGAHGPRRGFPAGCLLACSDPVLHNGGGLDLPVSRGGRQRAPRAFPATPSSWRDSGTIATWNRIRSLRRVVTGALEIARRDKIIGASLEAAPMFYVADPRDSALFDGVTSRKSPSHRARGWNWARAPRTLPARGCSRRRGALPPRRGAQMCALLEGTARSRHGRRPPGPLRPLQRCGGSFRESARMTPRDLGLTCTAAALAADQGSKLAMLYGLHFHRNGPWRPHPCPAVL